MARNRVVNAIDGSLVTLEVETICLHGDTPGAAMLASRIRAALVDAGVSVLPVSAASVS
jgi:5-oxoprolinase (ATP-hydrolysing) subunit A